MAAGQQACGWGVGGAWQAGRCAREMQRDRSHPPRPARPPPRAAPFLDSLCLTASWLFCSRRSVWLSRLRSSALAAWRQQGDGRGRVGRNGGSLERSSSNVAARGAEQQESTASSATSPPAARRLRPTHLQRLWGDVHPRHRHVRHRRAALREVGGRRQAVDGPAIAPRAGGGSRRVGWVRAWLCSRRSLDRCNPRGTSAHHAAGPEQPPALPAPATRLNRLSRPLMDVQASHQRLGALWKPTTTSCQGRV